MHQITNKSQFPIFNDLNIHQSWIASLSKSWLPVTMPLAQPTIEESNFWNFEFGSLGFV
jgi:hypothetical protein